MSESFTVPGVGEVRLGANLPKVPSPALRFSEFFDESQMVVPPPATLDYYTKAAPSLKRMYLNDREGCCVIASAMHQLGLWTANDTDSGGVVLATDQEIHSQYVQICGPGDQGCDIAAVLNWTQTHGLTAGGKTYKIDGYVAVDWTNALEVKVAQYLFGSLKLGIRLPKGWVNTQDGGTWSSSNAGANVGGHDVPTVGYDGTGVIISTWGGKRTITWEAFQSRKWLMLCYAELSPNWYGSDRMAPSGVDVDGLKAALDQLGGGVIPPLPPPPVVPPVIPPPGPGTTHNITIVGATQIVIDGKVLQLGSDPTDIPPITG